MLQLPNVSGIVQVNMGGKFTKFFSSILISGRHRQESAEMDV